MRNALLVAALTLRAWAAPIDCYFNSSFVTNVPQINAPCFVNEGVFSVSSSLLYDWQNTLNFTNHGSMLGTPGFRIDYVNNAGVRAPAENFINTGVISVDSPFFFGGIGGGGFIGGFGGFFNAALMVSAKNLVNRGGELYSAPGGLIRLSGDRVDLTRSAIGTLPILGPVISFPSTPTNFFPEPGLFDLYWGLGIDGTPQMAPAGIVNIIGRNLSVRSPLHDITNAVGPLGPTLLSLSNPAAYIYTNKVSETNWLVQGAFIGVRDSNVSVSVKFASSQIPTNLYKTIIVQLATQETNVLEGGKFLRTFYITDRLASGTNYVIQTNLSTGIASRPGTYEVTRGTPVDFLSGVDSNAVVTADLFYNSGQSNNIVTNSYAAYAITAANQTSFVPPVPGASLTNSAGRIDISANDLIFDRVRIRGESIVTIRATNLVSTSNSVVDVQNLALFLGSERGDLKVKNLAPPVVERTEGDIFLWSGAWTNQTGFLSTNLAADPMDPMLMVTNVVTNVVDIGYHVLIVDSQALSLFQPVFVDTFHAKSENVTISDIIRVTQNVLVEADTLTVDGEFRLGFRVHDWGEGNFPGLNTFSNLGIVTISGTGNYGCDRPEPYARMINRGTNTAFAQLICADVFENSGRMNSSSLGAISLNTRSGKLEGGQFNAGGDLHLSGTDLKLRNYVNQAGKAIFLSVTNTLADSGGDANNTFSTRDGFNLLIKPQFGDLLGSRFRTVAPRFNEVRHRWAAEDRGRTKAGFSNNAAIGRLIIEGDLDTQHTFSGTGSGNALYVDFLDLAASVRADLTNSLQIDTNLVIYFADANVPVEELDGQLNGRLRWVREFAGPNSSVDVALDSGEAVKVNRGLRQSRIIDSDADGVANAFDLDPFGGIRIAKIEVAKATPNTSSISFEAAANTTYVLEFTTSLFPPNWQSLTTFVNSSETNRLVTLSDTVPGTARQRYYRVRYSVP